MEGQVINNDIIMGFCTVIIFPLECEGLNEGFDFECFNVFEIKEWARCQWETSMDTLKGKLFLCDINKTYFPKYFVVPLI